MLYVRRYKVPPLAEDVHMETLSDTVDHDGRMAGGPSWLDGRWIMKAGWQVDHEGRMGGGFYFSSAFGSSVWVLTLVRFSIVSAWVPFLQWFCLKVRGSAAMHRFMDLCTMLTLGTGCGSEEV